MTQPTQNQESIETLTAELLQKLQQEGVAADVRATLALQIRNSLAKPEGGLGDDGRGVIDDDPEDSESDK